MIENKVICVIGAGSSGLTAIKQCIDNQFNVLCFEKTSEIGGLWRYHPEDEEGIASVSKSTIINSSKEMSAFSDFPPPDDYPNYMHNELMLNYFRLYAKHFDLEKYVNFNHEVIKVEMNNDFEMTGKWKVRVKTGDKIMEKVFDGVMVCNGHHVKPYIPDFPGQEKFRGQIIHSHSYKIPKNYEDKKVCVVGVGNSGLDIAVEIGKVASRTYLSSRRGAWILSRTSLKGDPLDVLLNRRFLSIFMSVWPWLANYSLETLANLYFDHKKYKMKPQHRILNQHVTINDELPNSILSGRVIVRSTIKEFTENGVIFEGTNTETPVDCVILATGYKIGFPFFDSSIINVIDNNVELYKYVFPLFNKHAHTLAFIGLIQPIGAIFPISEQQSRWFCSLMKGEVSLPSRMKMIEDIKKKEEFKSKFFYRSSRHTIEVIHIDYMNEIGEQYGATPNLLHLFFTDPILWYYCLFGPCVSYQWRLYGPNPWKDARDAIIKSNERVLKPLQASQISWS